MSLASNVTALAERVADEFNDVRSEVSTSLSGKSNTSHNHDGTYSASGHNHDGSYSATSHNHDSDYADISHEHSGADITSGTVPAAQLPLVPNPPVTLTYNATPTFDASAGNYRVMTMTGDATIGGTISNGTDGQMILLRCIASGANRTLTFHSNLKRPSHIPSTLVITSGNRGDVGLLLESSVWSVVAAQAYA